MSWEEHKKNKERERAYAKDNQTYTKFDEDSATYDEVFNLNVKSEVQGTSAYKELISQVPEEGQEYVQKEFQKMTDDWQEAYDMIASVFEDDEKQELFRQKLKEKYGNQS